MKRNHVLYITGVLFLFILISGVIYIQIFEEDYADLDNKYNIDIFNCSAICNDTADLEIEMKAYLKSIKKVSSNGEITFLSPKLKIGDVNFTIPMYSLNYIRYKFSPELYGYTDREDDENIFFENKIKINNSYLLLKKKAMKGSGIDTFSIDWSNNITEFIINRTYNKPHDERKKIWNSMLNLRKNIDSLYNNSVIYKNQTIKVYYFCGDGYLDDDNDGVPNSKDKCSTSKGDVLHNGCPDSDGDGVYDDVDKCKSEKGDIKCDGCKCPPTPICPGDKDSDSDGICDTKDKCPNEFGFPKYKGCPPPQKIVEKTRVKIAHNNSDGTFTVSATNPDGSKAIVKATLEIIQKDKTVIKDFKGNQSHQKEDFKKLMGLLKTQVDLTVYVVVKDTDGNELERKVFKDLDLICISNGSCGFVNTK